MNLVERFYPKNINSIVGNEKIYKKLLNDIIKSKKKGKYLLHGNNGTGKTTFVKLLSKKFKIKIQEIDINDIQIDENIKFHFKKTIIKKIILIDNVDLKVKGIETKMKKLKDYININNNNLIFIISNENKKSVFKSYEKLKTYKFKLLESEIIINFLKEILKELNHKLTNKNPDKLLEKIVKKGNNNIRKILLNLDILLSGQKKLLNTNKNNQMIKNNINDKTYDSIYKLISNSLIPYKENDLESYINKEKIFYHDPFLIGNSVFESYLKGENLNNKIDNNNKRENLIKSYNNLCKIEEITLSLEDGDYMNNDRNCFFLTTYISNNSFIKPLQISGKMKGPHFFPSNVSKDNKILNNKNKILSLKKDIRIKDYITDDFMYLYDIQKKSKIKKKNQLVKNTDIKNIFSITLFNI